MSCPGAASRSSLSRPDQASQENIFLMSFFCLKILRRSVNPSAGRARLLHVDRPAPPPAPLRSHTRPHLCGPTRTRWFRGPVPYRPCRAAARSAARDEPGDCSRPSQCAAQTPTCLQVSLSQQLQLLNNLRITPLGLELFFGTHVAFSDFSLTPPSVIQTQVCIGTRLVRGKTRSACYRLFALGCFLCKTAEY